MNDDPGWNPRKEAARKGGLSLVNQRGREYMAELGKRGGNEFHARYRIVPVGTSAYGIVRRADGALVRVIGSVPYRGEHQNAPTATATDDGLELGS